MVARRALQVLVGALVFCATIPVAFCEEASPLDKELDKVWGKERDIKVIEKRLFEKDGRHEFSLMAGMIPNDEFFNYYPVGLRYDYFLSETLGIEIAGAYLFQQGTDLKKTIEQFQGINMAQPLRKLQWHAGAAAYWAPLHGKLAAFSSSLTHFDLGLIVGAGVLATKKLGGGTETNKYDPMGQLGLGFQFFLSDSLALRIDYRHFFYWVTERSRISYPAEITLGLGLFTSAPR